MNILEALDCEWPARVDRVRMRITLKPCQSSPEGHTEMIWVTAFGATKDRFAFTTESGRAAIIPVEHLKNLEFFAATKK